MHHHADLPLYMLSDLTTLMYEAFQSLSFFQITVNDLPVGRDVDETLRLVQAFQFVDEHGEGTSVCNNDSTLLSITKILSWQSMDK